MDYQERILKELTSRYYNSKKDSGRNTIARRTTIQPEKHLYSQYNQNDGSLKEIEAINAAADKLAALGFVTLDHIAYGDEITCIHMVDAKKAEIEDYLFKKYGHVPKSHKMNEVQQIITCYQNDGPVAQGICRRLQESLNNNKIPAKYGQTADVLKALRFLECNEKRLYQRELSMLVFGSSKYLEENVRDDLCKEIRVALGRPASEEEMLDEILEAYFVYKEPSKVYLKGAIVLDYGGYRVELCGLKDGAELSYEQLVSARRMIINTKKLVTVENLTSFLRCRSDDSVFFYLSGHANRFQIMVLKKIYQDNSGIGYYHFGDIDAGGFIIHSSLCMKTGIPFQLLYMSERELMDSRYRSCLQSLTDNDVTRLTRLMVDERYRGTVEYMLRERVKLEQEIISLEVYGREE